MKTLMKAWWIEVWWASLQEERPFPCLLGIKQIQDAVWVSLGCGHAQRGSPHSWAFCTRHQLQQNQPLSCTKLCSYTVGSSFLLVLPELSTLVMVVLFRNLPIAIFKSCSETYPNFKFLSLVHLKTSRTMPNIP